MRESGSVSINTIGNTVEAYIKNSTVTADDNVYILADSHTPSTDTEEPWRVAW